MINKLIKVENLSKSVVDSTGTLEILKNINFKVSKQKTVAIIGASGSGKSTLLSLLAGLDIPNSGKIFLENQDLFALSEDERAKLRGQKIGFVFQNFQLLPNLTALENVMLPLELLNESNKNLKASEIKELATQMLEKVNLSTRLNHYPKVLSGGEQQRVALARAFIMKPSVLLADEPTGSLDFATGEKIINLMLDLNQQQQTTLILVTHDKNISNQCDQILQISAGQLIS